MGRRSLSHVIGFDDAPFPLNYRGRVKVVGAVFADRRFDGVLVGEVEKDGFDSADVLAALLEASKYRHHLQLVMLQGIALAGFNVVDVFALHERVGLPVLVVARREPDYATIRRVLLERIPRGEEKWAVIERLGPMEPAEGVYVQRVGISPEEARAVIRRLALYGNLPEPLRTAHLIASALGPGEDPASPGPASGRSRGRA